MNTVDSRFSRAWQAAWRDLGFAGGGAPLLGELLRHWSRPERRYHSLQHLDECLALFEDVRALARRPGEVAMALWFHDAVYDPERHDNEAESAVWARRALAGAGADGAVADRVHALVMATCHGRRAPGDDDARLLVDIDLAILGAAPARFAEYERQIRDEYGHVPAPAFLAGRRAVLRGFLDREAIYATPAFRARFEAAARANLARALAAVA